MSHTWIQNAEAFKDLDHGDGWEFCRLVACSVKPDEGNGNRSDRYTSEKVSANAFARKAGTATTRVMRFLTAWDAAAAAGWCVHSDDLLPGDALTTELPAVPWKKRDENNVHSTIQAGGLFDSSKSGGRPRAPISEIIKRVADDPKYAAQIMDKIVDAAPQEVARQVSRRPSIQGEIVREHERRRHDRLLESLEEHRQEKHRRMHLVEEDDNTPSPADHLDAARENLTWARWSLSMSSVVATINRVTREIKEAADPLDAEMQQEMREHAESIRYAMELLMMAVDGLENEALDEALAKILTEG